MKFLAPRWARILYPLGTLAGVYQMILAVVMIGRGESQTIWWINLVVSMYLVCFFGWVSYLVLFVPVVRITDQAVMWRVMIGVRYREVGVRDIVGYRFQDSFDIRLELRSGDEQAIRLSQVDKRKRSLLVAAIQKMAGEGTAAI